MNVVIGQACLLVLAFLYDDYKRHDFAQPTVTNNFYRMSFYQALLYNGSI